MRISAAAASLAMALLGAVPARAALSPEAQQVLQDGLRDLYALDYAKSRADFRKLIQDEPDNPFGYLFESGAIWWESSQEYGLFEDTPALEGLFEKDMADAVDKAQAWAVSQDSAAQVDGSFALGMALGTDGQWCILRHRWLEAYFSGRKAIKSLRRAVTLDPGYYDADLGLGVFDYQASRFAGVLRLGALLGGLRGDEERGLSEIETAMDKSRYSRPQSAEFLASIYILDRQDYAKALAYIQPLVAQYPDSPYFRFLSLALRRQVGDWDGSLADAESFWSEVKDDPAGFDRKLLTLVCGMTGRDCLSRPAAAAAQLWLDRAIEARPRRERFQVVLRLFRGYARDLLGRRREALADYAWVLAHRDWGDAHARAEELTAAPLTREAFLAYLRAKSQDQPWPPSDPKHF